MKTLFILAAFVTIGLVSQAQQKLLSYEDITYVLNNNLQKSDEFMQAKGYIPADKKLKPNNKKYTLTLPDNTQSEVDIRSDGRKLYMEIFTDAIAQFNLISNGIAQFILKKETLNDMLIYQVKDLGTLYLMVTDKVPYNPIKKDYDIRIISDKNITAYN